MKKIFWIAIALFIVQLVAIAQEKLLDKKVTLHYKAVTLRKVLSDLSGKYGVSVSYSSNQVPLDKKIDLDINNESLGAVFNKILQGTNVTYTEVGNQIVLSKKPTEKKKASNSELTKPQTSKKTAAQSTVAEEAKVEEQTVFIQKEDIPVAVASTDELQNEYLSQQSRIYNEYFEAQDSSKFESGKALKKDLKTALKILKREFEKLSDSLKVSGDKLINKDTLPQKSEVQTEQAATAANDTAAADNKRPAQVTFIYPVGSNGVESGKYTNNVSLNIIAGYNGGVEGAEIGSFANVNTSDVKGFQAAGFANLNNGSLKGFQTAGFANVNTKKVVGMQYSGFANYAGDTSAAYQAGGFANIVNGANFGGQFAGFANVTTGSMAGPQVAGFSNIANGNLKGAQITGFANVATQKVDGCQVSGFMNLASSVRGCQIGVFNISGKIRGSQIGVFNFADSVSGTQIGLLSFSKNGYHVVELSAGDMLYPSISFKTGTNRFYNIISAGYNPFRKDINYWYGYGVGTLFNANHKLPVNIDLQVNNVNPKYSHHRYMNLLNQLKVQVGYSFGKHFTIFAGPSLNLQISSIPESFKEDFSMSSKSLWEHSEPQSSKRHSGYITYFNLYPGFNAGLRF